MKKKIILGILSIGFVLTSFTLYNTDKHPESTKISDKTEINFQKISLDQAMKLAKKEHKTIFINAFAVWCAPCKRMQNATYKEAAVAKYFNEHFISLDIDVEKGNGPAIAEKYNVRAHPCLLFVDANGNLKKTILGFYDGKALLAQVKEIK